MNAVKKRLNYANLDVSSGAGWRSGVFTRFIFCIKMMIKYNHQLQEEEHMPAAMYIQGVFNYLPGHFAHYFHPVEGVDETLNIIPGVSKKTL